jgi:hypothetical protein
MTSATFRFNGNRERDFPSLEGRVGQRSTRMAGYGSYLKKHTEALVVPYVINERMCVSSDAHEMVIKGKKVTIPYAAKLLFEELQSMCINVDLQVK